MGRIIWGRSLERSWSIVRGVAWGSGGWLERHNIVINLCNTPLTPDLRASTLLLTSAAFCNFKHSLEDDHDN